MEFSKKYEYTLLALLELAISYPKGECLHIRQISELQNIPSRYLEQILATLRNGGLINSIRGAKGGYTLAREPGKITLLDAWKCVEGCGLPSSDIDTNPTSTGRKIIEGFCLEVNQAAHTVLQKYTLQDMYERLENENYDEIPLMYYI